MNRLASLLGTGRGMGGDAAPPGTVSDMHTFAILVIADVICINMQWASYGQQLILMI